MASTSGDELILVKLLRLEELLIVADDTLVLSLCPEELPGHTRGSERAAAAGGLPVPGMRSHRPCSQCGMFGRRC